MTIPRKSAICETNNGKAYDCEANNDASIDDRDNRRTRNMSRRSFLRSSAVTGIGLATGLSAASVLNGKSTACTQQDSYQRSASGKRWAVATVNDHATRAAAEVFKQGGNAIDAAVAASFMLSVVDGHNSGIGGGGFALVRTADGELHAIDGREEAPSKITPEHYLSDGQPDPKLSQTGPLAVGIPGLVAALWSMHQGHGKSTWESLVRPAAELAEKGFAYGRLASVIRRVQADILKFPHSAKLLMPGGSVPDAKDRFVQSELSQTLQRIAREGKDGFYQGMIPKLIAEHIQRSGGVISSDDFSNYQAKMRQPIESAYREFSVIGFPPPSSGGVHIAQMLGMLSAFDLKAIRDRSESDYRHLLLEVMKRAMADRAHWLGDSDYTDVPSGLIDPEYLKNRMADFSFDRVNDVRGHGLPPGAESQFFGDRHTTHLTTADADGNVVALTQTVNTSFGSKMIAPETGIVLNNEMDDFSLAAGVRNAFGLVGSQANFVAPGKRPLSSMSPTIVLNSQRNPVVTCGAAGGPRIITATLQNLVGVLDFELSMQQSIAAERVHHQWSPNTAVLEKSLPDSLVQSLRNRGHKPSRIDASAVAQGIRFGADKTMEAASDPRTDGSARGN